MKNETELIEACMNANTDIINKMDSLNNTIISEEIGLTLDYQIGAAYFLKYALSSSGILSCLKGTLIPPLAALL